MEDENFLFDFGQRTQGTTDAEQILLEHIDTLTLEDDLHDLYCNELKNNAEEWVTLALNAIKQGHYTAAKNEIIKHIQDLDEVSFHVGKNLTISLILGNGWKNRLFNTERGEVSKSLHVSGWIATSPDAKLSSKHQKIFASMDC